VRSHAGPAGNWAPPPASITGQRRDDPPAIAAPRTGSHPPAPGDSHPSQPCGTL
jgi:hypothetical protein